MVISDRNWARALGCRPHRKGACNAAAVNSAREPLGKEQDMSPEQGQSVVVSNIKMPFGSMVVFMVKWSLASIPALIILALIGAVLGAAFGGLFAGLMR